MVWYNWCTACFVFCGPCTLSSCLIGIQAASVIDIKLQLAIDIKLQLASRILLIFFCTRVRMYSASRDSRYKIREKKTLPRTYVCLSSSCFDSRSFINCKLVCACSSKMFEALILPSCTICFSLFRTFGHVFHVGRHALSWHSPNETYTFTANTLPCLLEWRSL